MLYGYPYINLVLEPGAFGIFSSSMAVPASFSHAENQPRNPRSPGWVLKLETCKKQVKKDSGSVHNCLCARFVAKRLDSQFDTLFTTPNPLWAFCEIFILSSPSQSEYPRSVCRNRHAENTRENTFLETNRYRIGIQYGSMIEVKILFEDSWDLWDTAGGLGVARPDIWM